MSHRFMTLPEIRRAAKTILPPGPWAFGDGGAETETTLRRNRSALKQLAIRQRVLRDVRHVDISTTFLGLELPTPFAIAPMGRLILLHPEGDLEMVRGASPSRNLAFVSGVTGWSVETLAQEARGPLMYQLYFSGPRSWCQDLLARVEACGYHAVCLTVDVQTYSRRERDIELRFNPQSVHNLAPNDQPPRVRLSGPSHLGRRSLAQKHSVCPTWSERYSHARRRQACGPGRGRHHLGLESRWASARFHPGNDSRLTRDY